MSARHGFTQCGVFALWSWRSGPGGGGIGVSRNIVKHEMASVSEGAAFRLRKGLAPVADPDVKRCAT